MIHLQWIQLANFKEFSELRCAFDDFTILAGLKQFGEDDAASRCLSAGFRVRPIAEHRHITHERHEVRKGSLQAALPHLGFRDTTWLYSEFRAEVIGTVSGVFSNGLTVELGVLRDSPTELLFTLSHPENDVVASISELKPFRLGS